MSKYQNLKFNLALLLMAGQMQSEQVSGPLGIRAAR